MTCFTVRVVTKVLVHQNSLQNIRSKCQLVQEEVNVWARSLNGLKIGCVNRFRYRRSNLVGRHVTFLSQQESWKGKITHR